MKDKRNYLIGALLIIIVMLSILVYLLINKKNEQKGTSTENNKCQVTINKSNHVVNVNYEVFLNNEKTIDYINYELLLDGKKVNADNKKISTTAIEEFKDCNEINQLVNEENVSIITGDDSKEYAVIDVSTDLAFELADANVYLVNMDGKVLARLDEVRTVSVDKFEGYRAVNDGEYSNRFVSIHSDHIKYLVPLDDYDKVNFDEITTDSENDSNDIKCNYKEYELRVNEDVVTNNELGDLVGTSFAGAEGFGGAILKTY